jgi:hypothetical protein
MGGGMYNEGEGESGRGGEVMEGEWRGVKVERLYNTSCTMAA